MLLSCSKNCRRFLATSLKIYFKPRRLPGFSLPEVIVSLSIIVMITAIFLSNYRDAEKRSDLSMSAQNLVSDIHLTQSYALGLAEYAGEVPSGGWGLHFDSATSSADRYIIFADTNANQRYDIGEEDQNSGGRTIYFSKTTRIKGFTGVTSPLDITFLPPDPITTIYGGSGTSTVVDIILTEIVNNTEKSVQVNFLGLAEALD